MLHRGLVAAPQLGVRPVNVTLGSPDAAVAQQTSQGQDRHLALRHPTTVGVPQPMAGDLYTAAPGVVLDAILNPRYGNGRSQSVTEQGRLRLLRRGLLKISRQGLIPFPAADLLGYYNTNEVNSM